MVLEDIQNHFLLFVADGHGGTVVSDFIADRFLDIFKRNVYYQMYKKHCSLDQEVIADQTSNDDQEVIEDQTSNDDRTQNLLEKALLGSIHELEDMLSSKEECDACGSTLVVCLLTPFVVVCANVGDSRSILITIDEELGSRSIVELSMDHKPSLPTEEFRIIKAGGIVYANRVDGELALSRALGDFKFKQNHFLEQSEQKVVCTPDIRVYKRDNQRDFLLFLASDGLWDVFTNDSLADFMISNIEEHLSPDKLSREVVEAAYKKGSTDNISCCIAFLFT